MAEFAIEYNIVESGCNYRDFVSILRHSLVNIIKIMLNKPPFSPHPSAYNKVLGSWNNSIYFPFVNAHRSNFLKALNLKSNASQNFNLIAVSLWLYGIALGDNSIFQFRPAMFNAVFFSYDNSFCNCLSARLFMHVAPPSTLPRL